MPEHTELPWAIDGDEPAFIIDANDEEIIAVHRIGRERAELIVRAVNGHAALLESCKHMLDYCPPGLMSSLQAAIDKAEGKLGA